MHLEPRTNAAAAPRPPPPPPGAAAGARAAVTGAFGTGATAAGAAVRGITSPLRVSEPFKNISSDRL